MNTFKISGHAEIFEPVQGFRQGATGSRTEARKKTDFFGKLADALKHFFGRMPDSAFFLFVFFTQLILTLQGIELSDEGFLANFYHGIFKEPLSLSYNFMFWLTGVIGGAWMKVFGFLGLWGARLAGALVNTFTLVLAYRMLRPYIRPAQLRLGLLAVLVCLNNDIKILNYNTLSSLLFVGLATLLLKGLFENRWQMLVLAGALVSLNTFIRIPNVLQLGLVVIIAYHNWTQKKTLSRTIVQSLQFFAGFMLAFGIMLLSIRMLGHWEAFSKAMDFLFHMGDSNSTAKTQNDDYGLANMIRMFTHYNLRGLIYAGIVVFAIQIFKSANRFLFPESRLMKSGLTAIYYSAVLAVLYLIATQRIDKLDVLIMVYGIPLLAAIPFLMVTKNKAYQLIFLTGIFMLLSIPTGSSHSVLTAGRFSLWIALPIALDFLANISYFNLGFEFRHKSGDASLRLKTPEIDCHNASSLLLVLILAAGLIHQYRYPFFDWHERTEMTHTIQHEKFGLIHTSKDRADQISELFAATRKYTKENDHILAYDRIPMVYYATNTFSFLSNPFPGVYRADIFEKDLQESLLRHGFLPVVVEQKIHTTGQGSRWPTVIAEDPFLKNDDKGRDNVMYSFLEKYAYKEAWQNQCFRILVPGVKTP